MSGSLGHQPLSLPDKLLLNLIQWVSQGWKNADFGEGVFQVFRF